MLSICLLVSLSSLCSCSCGSHPTPGDSGPGITVSNGAVRGCDVLLDAGDAGVTDVAVAFGTSTRGQYTRRGSQVAVSFIVREDKAFDENPVTISGVDGGAIPKLSLDSVNCYDRSGRVVSTPGVSYTASH